MNETEFELLCIGNALVDVFARDAEQVHIRYGINDPVQHVEIEKIEKILSLLSNMHPPPTFVSGGGAANVAKIAGFLGVKACFTGAIGGDQTPDHFGRLFEKDLTAAGIKLALHLKPRPTGICLILSTADGKTRIAASPSASLGLLENDINEEDIKKAKLVVVDGFMLDRPNLVQHILRLAGQHGKTIVIDLSSPVMAKERAKEIAEYARQYSLILFMNDAEAEAFYAELKHQYPKCLSLRNEGEFPVIVVKQGSRGAICFAGEKTYQSETEAVIPLETTSAGDAFCAGFLTAWVRNKPLSECTNMGNKAAALVLGAEGSQIQKNSGPSEPLF
jgi:sugar/nucleoside kinase (ribokinase family)